MRLSSKILAAALVVTGAPLAMAAPLSAPMNLKDSASVAAPSIELVQAKRGGGPGGGGGGGPAAAAPRASAPAMRGGGGGMRTSPGGGGNFTANSGPRVSGRVDGGRTWSGGNWRGRTFARGGGRTWRGPNVVIGAYPSYGYDDYAYDPYYDDDSNSYVVVEPRVGGDAVAYCMQRFQSYDPRTGTYLGYDGERHPCP
jgi:hypothetical protein